MSEAVSNSKPRWVSFLTSKDPANIVESPEVAEAIGVKVDASGGQLADLTLVGGVYQALSTPNRDLAGKLAETLSVKDFGAVGDGQTDDTAAFQAAFASGASILYIPPSVYFLTASLVIPPQMSVYSLGGPLVANPPSTGCVLLFAANVGICLTVGETTAPVHLPGRLENVAVVRYGGTASTIPAGSIGVFVVNAQAVVLKNVTSYGHDEGFYLKGASPDGITAWMDFCNTGRITGSHLVIDSMPEVRVSNSRFGMNGDGDVNCTNFVLITGGNANNPAGGPNTIVFTNVQWNQGQNLVTNWINFANQLLGSKSDTGLVQIANCYVETIVNGIVSDATWPIIRRVLIANTELNKDGAEWFKLDPATTLQFWALTNVIVFGNITLNNAFDHVVIDNLLCDQNVSFTSSDASSTLMIANLSVEGSMTFAGAWADLFAVSIHGAFTNTATGGVCLQDGAGTSYAAPYTIGTISTLSINFGTGSAPASKASYQSDGNFVMYGPDGTPNFAVMGGSGATFVKPLKVAALPTSSTLAAGCFLFASDGRKPGEGSGEGTGVPVFWDAGTSKWVSFCSGAAVTS